MDDSAARSLIAKLLAIYEKHPDTHEGRNALSRAEKLLAKYKLNNPKQAPTAVPHPATARVFSAFKKLLNTKATPYTKAVPDIGELERKLTQLLKGPRP